MLIINLVNGDFTNWWSPFFFNILKGEEVILWQKQK